MFKVGDEVKVTGNVGHKGRVGTIVNLGHYGERYYAVIASENYEFSCYFEYLSLAKTNKWNPLNYKSHFEPLKLP